MKLRDIMNEMSMPTIKNAEHAVDLIRQADASIKRGSPDNDLYGSLTAAAKYLLDDPSTKYDKYLKMAQNAKKQMQAYRSKVATQQVKHTTMQKNLG